MLNKKAEERYPVLEISLDKITENTVVEVEHFGRYNIEIMGVNKVFSGMPETAKAVCMGGINTMAEADPEDLKKLRNLPCKKVLLRSPGFSEIEMTVTWGDVCVAADVETIKRIAREAERQKKVMEILLMIDMGDLREGIWYEEYEEIKDATKAILNLPGVTPYGIGTNYSCYGTVIPTSESVQTFVEIGEKLERELGFRWPYFSAGNCSSFLLTERGGMPKRVNQMRTGAQHLFGIE